MRINPDRSEKVAVQLAPYVPDAVTVAPDGVIWTAGWIRGADGNESVSNVLRRFDPMGKLLASETVGAKGRYNLGRDATEESLLMYSKDRIGWLTNNGEYYEFGLDGRELGHYARPPGPPPDAFGQTLALGQNDDVLVGIGREKGLEVWSLDRASRSWHPVGLTGATVSRFAILGFDGDQVVVVDGITPTEVVVGYYAVTGQ